MNAKLLSLLALISFVTAQGPGADDTTSGAATPSASGGAATPSGGAIPPCVLQCVTQTATDQGCQPTDTTCVCSPAFEAAAGQCVAACTPEEQAAALQLQDQTCGSGAGGASGSGAASGSASITGSATILPTTAPGPISVSSRPASSGAASASVTKPASTGSATGSAASPSKTNGAASIAAQGVWAMAAGVLGIAVAL